MKLDKDVYQDGAEFYHCELGCMASYPHLVHGDYDMDGAMAARRQFALDWPAWVIDTPDYPSVMDAAAIPFANNH